MKRYVNTYKQRNLSLKKKLPERKFMLQDYTVLYGTGSILVSKMLIKYWGTILFFFQFHILQKEKKEFLKKNSMF